HCALKKLIIRDRRRFAPQFGAKVPGKGASMLLKTVSTVLILALFATSSSASVGREDQQTVSEMQKVALKAVEKNRQVTVVLKDKRDNKKKFTGTPSNVSEQAVTLTDKNSGQQSQVAFEEIRELRMKGSHLGLYVGIGAAAAGAVVAAYILTQLSSD